MIIVLFHALYLFGKYVYESFHPREKKTDCNNPPNLLLNVSESDYQDFNETKHAPDNVKVKFFPPVYVQRYNTVQHVLESDTYYGKIQKVIDFGCAELSFALRLKNTDGIQEIYCIDVDRPLLENCQSKVAPLHCDYISPRTQPLTINVCEGSVAHNDNKLANVDAVICIELIEHLYPADLDAFPRNVFGFIRPLVAIVTTPNADFNVLFNLNGFRHADHKFEWTRRQFQDWGNDIVSRYPDYEVSFHGIGNGPGGTEHLGACSQMAVFHRHTKRLDERPEGIDGLLKTVVSHTYPHRVDNRSDEEKILDEAVYYIRLFSSRDEELSEEVPLEKLMFAVAKFRISVEILRNILEEANWAIRDRENGPVVLVPPQSGFSSTSVPDFDDFLDNDYRRHGDDDDWDALEPGAPPSGYSFDSYMERDTQNHEEEENWDEEPGDTRHSSNSNLNSENRENYELHVSENVDRTSDSQWTMEDLNNEDPLLDPSQHQPSVTVHNFGTETELPSNSLSIELDCPDIDSLNISNDTLNSFEHNLSSLLPGSDVSDSSQSLGTGSRSSFSTSGNSTTFRKSYAGFSQNEESNTSTSVADSKDPKFGCAGACAHPGSNSFQSTKSKYDNEESNTESQTCFNLEETANNIQNSALLTDPHSLTNDCGRSISKDSTRLEFPATEDVDCHSVCNETSSISTVEATVLLSKEQSLLVDNKNRSLNAQQLLENNEFLGNERERSERSIDRNTSLLLGDKSVSENDDCHDLCSMYLQSSRIGDDYSRTRDEASCLNIRDLSSTNNDSYKNLDVSGDCINSSYQKYETDLNFTKKIRSDEIKSQDSMSFKSISDCSLDIQPKYTSSPQILTNIHDTETQNENKAQRFLVEQSLHDYKSTVQPTIQSLGIKDTDRESKYRSTPNIKETGEEFVENISPSTSHLSLQSNSDISLSTATSNGSSNVDKWYAAETNPMYQCDLVVLKGGNDTADNPNEETTSDSDATLSGSDRGKDRETNKPSHRYHKHIRNCRSENNLNEDMAEDLDCLISPLDSETVTFYSDNSRKGKITDELSCEFSKRQNFQGQHVENCYLQDPRVKDNLSAKRSGVDIMTKGSISGENECGSIQQGTTPVIISACDKVKPSNLVLPNQMNRGLEKGTTNSDERFTSRSKQISENVLRDANDVPTSSNVDDVSVDQEDLRANIYEVTKTLGESTKRIFEKVDATRYRLESTLETTKKMTEIIPQTSGETELIVTDKKMKITQDADKNVDDDELLDTPPNSWSPEIMDSGYPNSASVHDITPEYELSSIANDRISDSDSASVGEVPVPGFYENVEVENGDLANNNRDNEGNNVIAFEENDLDDLQPLIDVLENDMENENDIYVLQNGFPLWLLRILEMANPIDLEGRGGGPQAQLYPAPLEQAGGDAPNVNADNDEGFDSSSSDEDSDVEDDEADDATTVSSDETEDRSEENLGRDWRAGGDP